MSCKDVTHTLGQNDNVPPQDESLEPTRESRIDPLVEGRAMNDITTAFNISAVLFEEGEWWCAQVLDYDITAQAKSLPELRYELDRILFAHVCASAQLGRRPFEGLDKAPPKFWRMYERAKLRLELEDDTPFRTPLPMAMPSVIAKMKIAELSGDS